MNECKYSGGCKYFSETSPVCMDRGEGCGQFNKYERGMVKKQKGGRKRDKPKTIEISRELPTNQIILGDCIEVMMGFPADSIDCIVTDPPYGISFMGKDWDRALPPKEAFGEMFRVLKPGALAFVMSSPRQDVMWRMLSMLEGVGFQLRQSFISWIYKTGFPKAYDVSKGIDKKLGLKRKQIGVKPDPRYQYDYEKSLKGKIYGKYDETNGSKVGAITEPVSDLANRWEGWKSVSGLKPALECILMIYKPRSERTIVDNVLKWGTGAINVDDCRIPINEAIDDSRLGGKGEWTTEKPQRIYGQGKGIPRGTIKSSPKGRFPANLLVSDKAIDTGEKTKSVKSKTIHQEYGNSFKFGGGLSTPDNQYDDEGDASRYFDLDAWAKHHGFLDVPKPSKRERGMGNIHPTVKPIKLMAYLIELGCPPDGVVLDPFVGSGTTCVAAKRFNRRYVGIEIDPKYIEIANRRLEASADH